MRLLQPLLALQGARGMLFPWVPVFLATGIGGWFHLVWEPGAGFYGLAALLFALLVLAWRAGPELARPLVVALACVVFGALACGARLHLVAAPILGFRYYGPVEGRVVEIDRAQSDALRITLDQVVLSRTSPDRTPRRVRISLHDDTGPGVVPAPGQTVMLTANLTPPPGPSEPGSFDFRLMAFFDGLGAVGYSRTPVMLLAPPEAGARRIDRLRATLSAAIMARIPGQAGAFASGAVTGDRSGIAQATVADLRDSNLSHLLAISGMNMAFITGFVFALLRYGLALVPPLALRVNTKKVAAAVSLAVAAFYLALSGANVATERAFVMVAVALCAVLLDRRALSLRTVAISACLLLCVRPESLLSPGFQMSFAATIALIWGFDVLNRSALRDRLPRWMMPVVTMVLSSLLAGFATAPLAAAHFNRFTDYGLVANLLTAPAMGLLIMPGSVIAVLLWPIGLAGIGLWAMELGAKWILLVAHWIAGWNGSVTGIPAPGPFVIPLLAFGAIWALLWAGRGRYLGAAPMLVALAMWGNAGRPPLLISADGVLLGLMGPEGRALSAPKGAGFAADSWLENDGDLADQETAAARPGFRGPKGQRGFSLAGWTAVQLKGKGADTHLAEACAVADLVVLAGRAAQAPAGCRVIDATLLARTGALAVWPGPDGALRLVATERAQRLWTPRQHNQPATAGDLQIAMEQPAGP